MGAESIKKSSPGILHSLDSARAIVTLLVMLAHANLIIDKNMFHGIFIQGWCGVDFFFVLSGFLVAWIHRDKRVSAGRWFRNKFIRIYPAYWIYTTIAAVIHFNAPQIFGGGRCMA